MVPKEILHWNLKKFCIETLIGQQACQLFFEEGERNQIIQLKASDKFKAFVLQLDPPTKFNQKIQQLVFTIFLLDVLH